VNAKVGDGGYIKVTMLSRGRQPIGGFSTDDAMPITDSRVRLPVRWKNATQLDLRPGNHMRIRFELKSASLYSFWIE